MCFSCFKGIGLRHSFDRFCDSKQSSTAVAVELFYYFVDDSGLYQVACLYSIYLIKETSQDNVSTIFRQKRPPFDKTSQVQK